MLLGTSGKQQGQLGGPEVAEVAEVQRVGHADLQPDLGVGGVVVAVVGAPVVVEDDA